MAKEYYIFTESDLQVAFDNDFQKALSMGIPFKLIAKRMKGTKSQKQLAYYWGVVLPTILRRLYDDGYTRLDYSLDRLHTELKLMYFYEEKILLKTDTVTRVPKTLVTATVKQMAQFIDNVVNWSAENDIEIPEPEF